MKSGRCSNIKLLSINGGHKRMQQDYRILIDLPEVGAPAPTRKFSLTAVCLAYNEVILAYLVFVSRPFLKYYLPYDDNTDLCFSETGLDRRWSSKAMASMLKRPGNKETAF